MKHHLRHLSKEYHTVPAWHDDMMAARPAAARTARQATSRFAASRELPSVALRLLKSGRIAPLLHLGSHGGNTNLRPEKPAVGFKTYYQKWQGSHFSHTLLDRVCHGDVSTIVACTLALVQTSRADHHILGNKHRQPGLHGSCIRVSDSIKRMIRKCE